MNARDVRILLYLPRRGIGCQFEDLVVILGVGVIVETACSVEELLAWSSCELLWWEIAAEGGQVWPCACGERSNWR